MASFLSFWADIWIQLFQVRDSIIFIAKSRWILKHFYIIILFQQLDLAMDESSCSKIQGHIIGGGETQLWANLFTLTDLTMKPSVAPLPAS